MCFSFCGVVSRRCLPQSDSCTHLLTRELQCDFKPNIQSRVRRFSCKTLLSTAESLPLWGLICSNFMKNIQCRLLTNVALPHQQFWPSQKDRMLSGSQGSLMTQCFHVSCYYAVTGPKQVKSPQQWSWFVLKEDGEYPKCQTPTPLVSVFLKQKAVTEHNTYCNVWRHHYFPCIISYIALVKWTPLEDAATKCTASQLVPPPRRIC